MVERLWSLPEPTPGISASERGLVGVGYGGIPVDMSQYTRGEWDLWEPSGDVSGDWNARQAPVDTWVDAQATSNTWIKRI